MHTPISKIECNMNVTHDRRSRYLAHYYRIFDGPEFLIIGSILLFVTASTILEFLETCSLFVKNYCVTEIIGYGYVVYVKKHTIVSI